MSAPVRGKFLASVLAILAAFAQVGTLIAAPLRVAAFNVEHGLYPANDPSYQDTARILKRINADIVGLCELMVYDPWLFIPVNDHANFPALAAELELPYHVFDASNTTHRSGIASRYPIAQTIWVSGSGMTRSIPLARIAVPDTQRDVWVAMLHLKAKHDSDLDQHKRAAELHWLRQAILANCDPANDIIVLMGDFNMVSPTDLVFTNAIYAGVPYPLNAPKDADGYFVPEQIFKLDLRHAGNGGESWTWISDGIFPNGALDHIMVNARVRALGVACEIYDTQKDAAGIDGLVKYGPRPPVGASYGSDHLPVFADLSLQEISSPPSLSVDASGGLRAEIRIGGPYGTSGSYILRNNGASSLDWTASCDANWITLSASSGTISPGGGVLLRATTTALVAELPPGNHRAILTFRNSSSGIGDTQTEASVFVGPFVMDGLPDAAGYTLAADGITLRAAVRGTRLYVATQSAGNQTGGNDHHILIANSLLESATSAAPWAKRGSTALPAGSPFLAAEGVNTYAGWFNTKNPTRLTKSTTSAGVLEGSIDLVEEFGSIPEFVYLAAVAYQTSDASPTDAWRGRVVSQVPAAAAADDNITPDEFLRVPVRSVTDSAADGRFDVLVPGRGFAAKPASNGTGLIVGWPSIPGRKYRVWRSYRLDTTVWENIHEATGGARQWELSVLDSAPIPAGGSVFYRVELTGTSD